MNQRIKTKLEVEKLLSKDRSPFSEK